MFRTYTWKNNHTDLILGASLPHVQVSPQRVEIHEDQTLRLYCRAGGSPSPGLTWKKRGGTLPPQVRNLSSPQHLLSSFFPLFLASASTLFVRLCRWSCSGFDTLISFPVCLWVSFVVSCSIPCLDVCSGHSLARFPSV